MLEIEQASRLIGALKEFAARDAGESFEESPADRYDPPILSSWDALKWFELIQDWEIVDFLVSRDRDARRLVISLQALLIWYGQEYVDEMHKRLRVMSIIN
ncbi:MAG: hypothetical protein HZB31_01775 [Nitrospirae bacterium]|nr:hypothetical protein [Nitrospirota bacterium]